VHSEREERLGPGPRRTKAAGQLRAKGRRESDSRCAGGREVGRQSRNEAPEIPFDFYASFSMALSFSYTASCQHHTHAHD
jgi:hypothetical protein